MPYPNKSSYSWLHKIGSLDRHRTVLVKFTRSCEAATILANCTKLQPGIFIKPHLTQQERANQNILLQERRSLINSGIPKNSIKLCGNVIYINNKWHGSITASGFQPSSTLATSTTQSNPDTILQNEVSRTDTIPQNKSSSTEAKPSNQWLPNSIALWNARSLVNKLDFFQSLVLVYINDLPNSISNTACYIMFADDTEFIKSISCFKDHLLFQQDIHVASVELWCQTWKLSLNIPKYCALRFSLSQHQTDSFEYALDGEAVCFTGTQRDLGVITTANLAWTDHYNHICLKAYRSLNLIRRTISASSPTNLKKQLYILLVRSHLCYCSQVWRLNLIKDISSIECVQRKATKFILNNYTSDYKSRLEALQILSLTMVRTPWHYVSGKVPLRSSRHNGHQ